MTLIKDKYLRARLLGLAIVITIAFLLELVVFYLFAERPVLQVKMLGMISLGLIAFLLHTTYKVWDWFNNPIRESDLWE